MVFAEDGSFRLIHFEQDFKDPSQSVVYAENQALFVAELNKFFKEKIENGDQEFMRSFVSFCTGSMYLKDGVRIKIEFSKSYTDMTKGENEDEFVREGQDWHEYLPRTHTCVQTLVIPATAYDGNMEIFEFKLRQAMKFTSGAFDIK